MSNVCLLINPQGHEGGDLSPVEALAGGAASGTGKYARFAFLIYFESDIFLSQFNIVWSSFLFLPQFDNSITI